MRPFVLQKNNKNSKSLYEQLYSELKKQILAGDIETNERCPSVRGLAKDLSVSVTTVLNAYNQLVDEGYLDNQPGSGYYAKRMSSTSDYKKSDDIPQINAPDYFHVQSSQYLTDDEIFDFTKWKKCAARVYNDYFDSLLFKSDLMGEESLRIEISKYLLQSRGVHALPENIVISAGTQQLAFHLGRVLRHAGISIISLEKPGFAPVRSMFSDAGFSIIDIPVHNNGIDLNMLPSNISSAVYVNPSNQFPTGAIMPIASRQELISWAETNNSYIIEDDYDSELRYFGKPLPSVKSLDVNERVIYLGSFSSTLFDAIKISYMVLPSELTSIFDSNRKNYAQTCSKAEQLTLALFMHEGYYYSAIRKKRALYSAKLEKVIDFFESIDKKRISLAESRSGLSVIIHLKTDKDASVFLTIAEEEGIKATFIPEISGPTDKNISVIFNSIPMKLLDRKLGALISSWNRLL